MNKGQYWGAFAHQYKYMGHQKHLEACQMHFLEKPLDLKYLIVILESFTQAHWHIPSAQTVTVPQRLVVV